MKLKKSVIVGVILFSLIPLCILGVFSIYEMNKKIDTMLKYNIKAVSENQITKIQEFANERKAAMEKLSNYAFVADAIRYSQGESDKPVNVSYMKNILVEHKNYSDYIASISIIDRDFHVVSSSEHCVIGEESRLKYVDEKYHTGNFIIGDVYERDTDDGVKKVLPAYVGVFDEDVLLGYISVELETTYFEELRTNMESMSEGTFYLLDGNYTIITAGKTGSKTSLEKFTTNSSGPSEFHEKWNEIDFEKNPAGEIIYKYNNDEYITYYSNIENTEWSIRISENLSEQKRAVKYYMVMFVLILSVVVIGVIITQLYMRKSILSPIFEAMNIFDIIAEEQDYTLRMPVKSKNEIGTFMKSINELLDYIETDKINDKNVQSDLKIQAETDAMTGVKNKKYIEKYAKDITEISSETGEPLIIGFLDIDDFKRFNTDYGHQKADEVICHVANVLKNNINGEVGRVGGDEFLFCCQGEKTEEEIENETKAVLKILEDGYVNPKDNIHISITCSIGIVMAQGENLNYIEMVHKADEAMYQAKNAGKNSVVLKKY